jgi:dihydrodipicolinate synthase/N-acetylneuraminate lyase
MDDNRALSGVFVPAITIFTEDGEVDGAAFEAYIDFLASKLTGISVCAIYGSGILMRPEQRRMVAEIALKTVEKRAFVSVFVGAPDTDTSVELARHAEKIGVQAITCVAPFYYKQVEEALYRHYLSIIQSVDIPVYAYDSPVFAGNYLSINLLKRLADQGMAGVITGAATLGLEHVWTVLNGINNEHFSVLSIRDGLALPAIMNGAKGFESGVGNFFPELVMEFYQSVLDQRYADAVFLQDRMLKLRDISHGFGRNIPTLHALIAMRGIKTGYPRRPFFLLAENEIEHLRTQLMSLDSVTPLV